MSYDLVIVGGGLAGASLAKSMCEDGARVLVLEREEVFRDRVRGEAMHPWGVSEAQELGLYEALLEACAHQTSRWITYLDGKVFADRDLAATNPYGVGELNFYHPEMQQTILDMAGYAGAEIRRGARVKALHLGPEPWVEWAEGGSTQSATCRLVVGADGSRSVVRRLAGFEVEQDTDRLSLCGVMMENSSVPDDAVHQFQGVDGVALFFPQGHRRSRTYIGFPTSTNKTYSGEADYESYMDSLRAYGVPEAWLEGASLSGPLAQFSGADSWVEHPAKDGVVLIGDAAAKPDPDWGCGLSLTLMDVRTLRDELRLATDWHKAAHQYADRAAQYFADLHAVEQWFTDLTWDQGVEADARRTDILAKLDQPGAPDIIGLGPTSPKDMPAG